MATARCASGPKRIRTVEGSCWQCKDQRVLCKLEKPTCSQCRKAGRSCEYGRIRLRWGNGVASRGRNAAQNAPAAMAHLISPQPAMPSRWQINYFVSHLLPMFSLRDSGPEVDYRVLAQDPLLNQAIVSISNAHYLFRSSTSDRDNAVYKAHNRIAIIKAFRKHLQAASEQESVQAIFLDNVILCILDGMIEPSQGHEHAAHHHFVGGRAILELCDCLDALLGIKKGLQAVMLSVFATGDLTQAVLSGDEPYFKPWDWLNFRDHEGWWTWTGHQNTFLELMAICSQVASIAQTIKQSDGLVPVADLAGLLNVLDRTRYVTRFDFPNKVAHSITESLEKESETWAAFCSAYRAAIQIFAYRALLKVNTSDELVQTSVREGIVAACETKYPGKLAHCLLFPMLVLGAHSIQPEQQKRLRHTVRETAAFLSFGCVRVMDAFLNDIWRRPYEDLDWWQRFEGISRNAFIF